MHWDGTVSLGNILTIPRPPSAVWLEGEFELRFICKKAQTPMNNLAAITERLQHAVEQQDSRSRDVRDREQDREGSRGKDE